MAADPRPEPPADLSDRPLPLRVLAAASRLHRIHRREHEPVFFGPEGRGPLFRFDDPEGRFKVCYAGEQAEAAFVEALLREPSGRLIAWSDLEARSLAELEVRRDLRLVELLGPGLRRLGATAEVASTRDYTLSQAWSRAFWAHPEKPDGILYRCRHDDSVRGVAVFNRARRSIRLLETRPLAGEARWLGELAERYGFGLTL